MEIECVVDSHSQTGEGAVWDDAAQRLYWVDIPAGLVHRFDPASGRNESRGLDEDVACLAVRESGGLVIATRSGFHFFDFETGGKRPIDDPEAHLAEHRFNDGTTDPRGRFWAGTMKDRGKPVAAGSFYRLDPDLRCHAWESGFFTTNGLAFSPDGRTMYLSDSHASVRTIWACDYDLDDGIPSNRRVFFDTRAVAGRPDGGTVDADGCYWMAGVSGWQLVRLTPSGTIDRIIDMPVERPSKPMFGGANLDTLYVTSIANGLTPGSEGRQKQAGGLFAITGLGVKGLPQTRFAG